MTFTDWIFFILIAGNLAGWTLMYYHRAMSRFHKWNADRGWRHFTDAMDCLQAQRDLMAEMEERKEDSGDWWKEAE